MTKAEDIKRLNAIVDGASRLPVENQECIKLSIQSMLFTKNLIMRDMHKLRNVKSIDEMLSVLDELNVC